MSGDLQDPSFMPIDEIETRCLRENQIFQRRGQSDERFCLELFRRALWLSREAEPEAYQQAWAAMVRCHEPSLRRLVAQSPAFAALRLAEPDDLCQNVWMRFSLYGPGLTIESLPQILAYLQKMMIREILEVRRRKRPPQPVQSLQSLEEVGVEPAATDGDPVTQAEQRQFDALCLDILQDPVDRLVFLMHRNGFKRGEISEQLQVRGLRLAGRKPTERLVSDALDRSFKLLKRDPRIRALLGEEVPENPPSVH